MMNLLVLGLLGMNLCLAKSLADAKDTTVVDVLTTPVRQAADKVMATTKDIMDTTAVTALVVADTAVDYTKDKANKVSKFFRSKYNKAKEAVMSKYNDCKAAVNQLVDDVKLDVTVRCRMIEESIVKNTVIYKDMQAQLDELQAKVDSIADNKATLEKKVVNRPKNVKKPAKVNA